MNVRIASGLSLTGVAMGAPFYAIIPAQISLLHDAHSWATILPPHKAFSQETYEEQRVRESVAVFVRFDRRQRSREDKYHGHGIRLRAAFEQR